IRKVMDFLKVPENEPIEHKMVSNAIEKAQKRVEQRNFGTRKNVLEYDDVMNLQRKAVYSLRDKILMGDEIHELLLEAVTDVVHRFVDEHMPEGSNADEFDPDVMIKAINAHFQVEVAYDPSLGTHYEEVA